jgi:excinuclease UvrABC ATPase subunit
LKLHEEEMERLLYSPPFKVKTDLGKFSQLNMKASSPNSRKYITNDVKTMSERTQKQVEPYITTGPCRACKGTRLSQTTLSCKINGHNIAELAAMEAGDLINVIREIDDPTAQSMVETLTERLQHLVDIGLEYLSLNRETDTLSGGESQRVKIVSI